MEKERKKLYTSKTRKWLFTRNNYKEEDEAQRKRRCAQKVRSYVGYAREEGKKGTKHRQGVIVTKNKKKRRERKERLGKGYYRKQIGGRLESAIDYWKKGGTK